MTIRHINLHSRIFVLDGENLLVHQTTLTDVTRMHILQRSLQEAELMVSRAETLFIRLLGGDQGLMAQ